MDNLILSPKIVLNDLSLDHLPVQINHSDQVTYRTLQNLTTKIRIENFREHLTRHTNIPESRSIISIEHIDKAIISIKAINDHKNVIKEAIITSVPPISSTFNTRHTSTFLRNYIRQSNCQRNWQRYRYYSDFNDMTTLNRTIDKEFEKPRNKHWSNSLTNFDKGSASFWNITKIIRKYRNPIPILDHNN